MTPVFWAIVVVGFILLIAIAGISRQLLHIERLLRDLRDQREP